MMPKMQKILILLCFCIGMVLSNAQVEAAQNSGSIFYVDDKKGDDANTGAIESPFKTLDSALELVANRVKKGIRSDKIYLRTGRYKKISDKTLYRLELKGTPDDFAELSAMPCEPNTPGCVQRKSGNWYENVVFDAGYRIETPWKKIRGKKNLWKTDPGYTRLEWTQQNLWPWTRTKKGFPITNKDESPETSLFTVAPYMLMQDGEPLFWADYTDSITAPGMRTYDHETAELFVRPYGDKNPNSVIWESWYGGPEDYEVGTLHLDGEGRGLFDGNLEFVALRGFEFYLFNKIFEFHRRKYDREEDRVYQKHVIIEDNLFRYGWMHFLLDANTVHKPLNGKILPRYSDRSHWTARNNVYYRPSRECFQLHGDDHVFEYNDIIEHIGPWAGPAAVVSAVNTRNTRNAKIRNNYIFGHGKNDWGHGSIFMIEVSGGDHIDSAGDYIYGGQTYENNIFEDITGPAMILGKGGARMRDITVRNNVFKTGTLGPAIRITTPHWNLNIENNIFYDQKIAIEHSLTKKDINYSSLPSFMGIRNNIFANNKSTIDSLLLHKASNLYVDNNLFYENEQPTLGERPLNRDPMFRSVEKNDFRPKPEASKNSGYNYVGPYPSDGSFIKGTDWWNRPVYTETGD